VAKEGAKALGKMKGSGLMRGWDLKVLFVTYVTRKVVKICMKGADGSGT
jgi:hypothetical protein